MDSDELEWSRSRRSESGSESESASEVEDEDKRAKQRRRERLSSQNGNFFNIAENEKIKAQNKRVVDSRLVNNNKSLFLCLFSQRDDDVVFTICRKRERAQKNEE